MSAEGDNDVQTSDDGFGDVLRSRTETYADQVTACVNRLPPLIRQHDRSAPDTESVAAIQRLESECDRMGRQICSVLSSTTGDELGFQQLRVHLRSGALLELYRRLDEVANRTEQFAEELAAISPTLSDETIVGLYEMTTTITTAMAHLSTIVTEYVGALTTPDETVSVSSDVARIRELESRCDRIRNEILSEAFAETASTTAVVSREFAVLLDSVIDGIEDVTDHLCYISGNQPWAEIEPVADR